VTIALVYGPQLFGEFIWDDQILVVENLLTDDWHNLPRFFTVSLWESTPVVDPVRSFYRPLMLLELWLDRALVEPPVPWLHRLHNLAWHGAGVALLWALLVRLRPGRWLALPAAALYALHPLQSEVVSFTSARNDAMASALMLGALLVLWPERASLRKLVLGGALFGLALLSKEVAVVTPVVLLGLDLCHRGRLGGRSRYVALAAVLAGWAALRLALELETLLSWPREPMLLLRHYAEVLVVPGATSPTAYTTAIEPGWTGLVLAGTGLALLVGLGGRQAWLGVTWALLAFLPCLPAVAVTDQLPYRYLTLPLAGLAVALHGAWPQRAHRLVGGLVVALLAAGTWLNAAQWADSPSLWRRGWDRSPGPRAACGLFKSLEDDPAQAHPWLDAALGPPPAQYCCFSATRFYLDQGNPQLAMTWGREALARGCDESGELLGPLAIAEAALGEWQAAEAHARDAVPDPTGLAPVVLSAAALRRGDRTVLDTWSGKPAPEGSRPLEDQVDWLLGLARE